MDVAIPTGIGWARNSVDVLAGDIVIAIGGRAGTLSELAFAWRYNKPIIAVPNFGGWAKRLAGARIDDRRSDHIYVAKTVDEVISLVKKLERD